MVKGTVVGTTDTLREMQRYEQLSQHGADNWKIQPGAPLYDTIVIVTGESVRRDYMSVTSRLISPSAEKSVPVISQVFFSG